MRSCAVDFVTARAVADDYDTETTTYDNPLAELLGVTLSTLNSAADDIENARWPIIVVGIGGDLRAALCNAFGHWYLCVLPLCVVNTRHMLLGRFHGHGFSVHHLFAVLCGLSDLDHRHSLHSVSHGVCWVQLAYVWLLRHHIGS